MEEAEHYSIEEPGEGLSIRLPPGLKPLHLLGGVVGLLVVAGLVFLAVQFLGDGGHYRLSAQNPTLSHPDGIRITLSGDGALQLDIDSIPREVFLEGGGGADWQQALEALPPYLILKSPIYILDAQGEASIVMEISIPNDSQPYATLDLYRWDAAAGRWIFVAGHVDPGSDVLRTDFLPPNVAVFQTHAVTPLISTILEPDQTLEAQDASALNLVMPTGLIVTGNGGLTGSLVGGWQLGTGYAVMPLVRVDDSALLATLFSNETAIAAHIQNLVGLAVDGGYDGVAIDYRGLLPAQREIFSQFISALAEELHGQGKRLVAFLPAPAGMPGAWETGAYDWRAIGAAADIVALTLADSPGDYTPNGQAAYLLSWAVGEISRYKLHMLTSSLSVDEVAGVAHPISYDEAIEPLGMATIETLLPEDTSAYPLDETLTFDLNGTVSSLGQDLASGVYRYTHNGEGSQEHQVWIVTAAALRGRLDMAASYHLGGVVVEHLLSAGNDAGMFSVVTEFKVNMASSFPSELALSWQISGPEGFSHQATTNLGAPMTWAASTAGDYTVSAQLVGARLLDRGSVTFQVGQEETLTPAPPPVVVVASGPAAPATAPEPEATPPPSAAPPPVAAAGASGGFELGGQVNGYISRADLMHIAGMTWVKYQLPWAPGMNPDSAAGFIAQAHENNFRVLISITGRDKYPSSIDFNSFIPFLEGVARLGPDAIEIWNEQNIDREWPVGQISATDYVNRMLAPGYNAINSVNPNIIVISGAPAPTGYWGGCDPAGHGCDDWLYLQQMASAGAANYMDCAGAHYNSGATSPSVEVGHPADGGDHHYTWYYPGMVRAYSVLGRPICWTELGYVSGEGYGALPSNFSWGSATTVSQQAAWLAETVRIAQSSGNVRLLIVWNVDFLNWDPNDPMAGYAIIRPGGVCPACDALAAVMP